MAGNSFLIRDELICNSSDHLLQSRVVTIWHHKTMAEKIVIYYVVPQWNFSNYVHFEILRQMQWSRDGTSNNYLQNKRPSKTIVHFKETFQPF